MSLEEENIGYDRLMTS